MYSDRPQLVIACEIMMGGLALLFNDYNKVCVHFTNTVGRVDR
jgi:hypothetical protein